MCLFTHPASTCPLLPFASSRKNCAGEVMRGPHAVSVHIGVDRVDPAHYGSPMTLQSCENDAKAMFTMAEALGYDALMLVNEQATTGNFTSFMRCHRRSPASLVG